MAKEQQKIIKTLYKNTQQDSIDIEKLEKCIIINKPIVFNKKIHKLDVITNQLLPDSISFSEGITINQEFENFPEWMIPNVYVHHQFYSSDDFLLTDGSSIENASFFGALYHIWKENGENNWIFQFACWNISRLGGNPLPIYIDISLYFNNPRSSYEI